MPGKIAVTTRIGTAGSQNLYIDSTPDECPICHRGGAPALITAAAPDDGPAGYPYRTSRVEVFFQCVRQSCQSAYIARYRNPNPDTSDQNTAFVFVEAVPTTPHAVTFDPIIQEVSPTFVEIMNQVAAAESAQLSQIVGIGLRKALEFLIKDFAKLRNKDDQDALKAIETSFLASVIAEYIDHPKLKAVAARATWLGNDETHYTRRWEDRDIQDLRKLIQLTTSWIVQVMLSDRYELEMPDPKKK